MEIWTANPAEAWVDAEKAGQTVALGTTYPDATEGWFVPTSVVTGADAVAPDLKSVSDLPKYKDLFADPEEPGKGRFYNCPAGWNCEVVNTKKLEAYGLDRRLHQLPPGHRRGARRGRRDRRRFAEQAGALLLLGADLASRQV